jgi:hypothetical protein
VLRWFLERRGRVKDDITIQMTMDPETAESLYMELDRALYGTKHYQEYLAKRAFPNNVKPIRPVNPLHLPPCEDDDE